MSHLSQSIRYELERHNGAGRLVHFGNRNPAPVWRYGQPRRAKEQLPFHTENWLDLATREIEVGNLPAGCVEVDEIDAARGERQVAAGFYRSQSRHRSLFATL